MVETDEKPTEHKRKRGARGKKNQVETDAKPEQNNDFKKTRRSKKGKYEITENIQNNQIESYDEIKFTQSDNAQFDDKENEFGILDTDTRSYFKNIESLIADSENIDELELMVDNVYEELNLKELMICTDYEGL
jgi:hypothetical protein